MPALTKAKSRRMPSARTVARSAAKRRARYLARIAQASGASYRRRLWTLLNWLASEGLHAKPQDQDRLFAELLAVAERFNQGGDRDSE